MSLDVLTIGSSMRIPLLYRGEYSQWVERFMNYLEEQTDGESMINSIKNGDQPLPRVTHVSIAGTTSTEQPSLKDKSMWSDQEKIIQKIDCLARSLLIQGLPNDIYSLIDSNKTAKDLCDALVRHMLGSEYGEQDRKAAVLYEYETFKATEGELLLDTYIRYLQVINDLKKCGYSNDNYINIDALYNILKQNQGDVNDAMGSKKKNVVVTSDPLALIAVKTKVSKSKEKVVISSDSEGSDADDFSELKKITALLAKAFNRRKFYSKPTNNNLRTSSTSQSVIKKQEFVKSDDKQVEKKADEKKHDMSRVKCYNCKKEGHFAKDCKKAKVKDYEYYKTKMLLAKKDKDEQVLLAEDQAWMELSNDSNQEINANMAVHMIMPSKDNLYNGRKRIGFKNPSYFEKAKDLRPTLYDEKVIGLGYTLMFLTHSDEALEIEKFKRSRENKIEFAYDYGNLNASYVNEKINFEDDYFEEIINPDFEKFDSPFQQTKCDKEENPKVIAPAMFKLNVSQCVSPISMTKSPCDSNNVENLDTFSSVTRPKHNSVVWKKKGSSNTSNVDLSAIVQICLWIIDSGCSKHMTGNRALLANFVEKFLGTVRFGNNDFVVIAGYGDVVIGSMTIKKVYYVEGLGHNLFSVGQFCDKGLEVAFRKSTCFVRNEDGVDLLTGDRSSNLYTIALNEVASNSLTCLLAKASSL
nr:integrase, catalytic region, zinc finger, CCHC-type, peptidase aspartic, catalytic [Tanacetum cinerariifolium]